MSNEFSDFDPSQISRELNESNINMVNVIDRFHRMGLGRRIEIPRRPGQRTTEISRTDDQLNGTMTITEKNESNREIIGYVLPVSESQHFMFFKDGSMFVIEATDSSGESSKYYKANYDPNESPLFYNDNFPEAKRFLLTFGLGTDARKVASNEDPRREHEMYDYMDRALEYSQNLMEQRRSLIKKTSQDFIQKAADFFKRMDGNSE